MRKNNKKNYINWVKKDKKELKNIILQEQKKIEIFVKDLKLQKKKIQKNLNLF